LIKKLSLVPHVTLHPPQKDMRKVYGRCKILLAPSTCEEAYGRVATEAQFSGIPVIASNRGGLPEAVGPGGILLGPEEVDEWVKHVRRLWRDKAYYASLSKAALDYAARPALTWEMQADLWEKSFEDAVCQPVMRGAEHGY
jgi:glycosyltransferase involved in cell wall biosynthesis